MFSFIELSFYDVKFVQAEEQIEFHWRGKNIELVKYEWHDRLAGQF